MFLCLLFYRLLTRFGLMQEGYLRILNQESGYWSIKNFINEAGSNYEIIEKGKKINFNKEISLKNIYFSYSDNDIIRNSSLKIKKGDTIVFLGESGAGKSTLIDLIIGFYKHKKGEIKVDSKVDIGTRFEIILPLYG